jgi:hypothetical protein
VAGPAAGRQVKHGGSNHAGRLPWGFEACAVARHGGCKLGGLGIAPPPAHARTSRNQSLPTGCRGLQDMPPTLALMHGWAKPTTSILFGRKGLGKPGDVLSVRGPPTAVARKALSVGQGAGREQHARRGQLGRGCHTPGRCVALALGHLPTSRRLHSRVCVCGCVCVFACGFCVLLCCSVCAYVYVCAAATSVSGSGLGCR